MKHNVQQTVKQVLEANRKARDCNATLLQETYKKINKSVTGLTYDYFWGCIANGTYPSVESIVRSRRKLQEEDYNLRGDNWDKRHQHAEHIKQTINTNPTQAIIDIS